VRKLVVGGDAPTMAQLVALDDYADLDLPDHFASWSLVDFLLAEHAAAFADLLGELKGITGPDGIADGSRVPDVQREVFRTRVGVTYPELDEVWRAWVLATY
jgi:hypothetical protein